MNLLTYIFPKKIVEIYSAVNGKIQINEIFGKKYIVVGNLTQSGQSVNQMWKKFFRKIKLIDSNPQQILLLGVAGGTLIHILNNIFPNAKIIGVDIDPLIVNLGKKYFDLDKVKNTQIKISDAQHFVQELSQKKNIKFDLIISDLFMGRNIPKFTENKIFLKNLFKLLNPGGLMIFNRLYFQNYKSEARVFLDKIKEMFKDINSYHLDFNIFITVRNS